MALLMKTRKDTFNCVAGTGSLIVEQTTSISNVRAASILRVGTEEPSQMDIKALSKALRLGEALFLLSFMDERGIHAKVEDYTSLLQGCGIMKDLDTGMQVHSFIVQSDPESTLVLYNALVHMYCKCGSVADAHSLFDTMNDKDVFTWTTMIAGYAILGPPVSALNLFWNMKGNNVNPDEITFLSIIKACAKLKILEHGKQIHAHIKKSGINENLLLRSSLVDMYAKC
eukprot:c5792_g1_i1 orf=866-1549(+)